MIDLQEKRLEQLSATLTEDVVFGYGLVGRPDKGGTISITRTKVVPGIWKTSTSKINLNGRLLMFKTINKQKDETRGDFKGISPRHQHCPGLTATWVHKIV